MNKSIIIVIICVLYMITQCQGNVQFHQFRQCYGTPASERFIVKKASTEITVPTDPEHYLYGQIVVNSTITIEVDKHYLESNVSFYKFSQWHEQSGARIKYNGPFSLCDLTQCKTEENEELKEGEKVIKTIQFSRPLVYNLEGTWETTFIIYEQEEKMQDETLCIDLPFKIQFKENEAAEKVRAATKSALQVVKEEEL